MTALDRHTRQRRRVSWVVLINALGIGCLLLALVLRLPVLLFFALVPLHTLLNLGKGHRGRSQRD